MWGTNVCVGIIEIMTGDTLVHSFFKRQLSYLYYQYSQGKTGLLIPQRLDKYLLQT